MLKIRISTRSQKLRSGNRRPTFLHASSAGAEWWLPLLEGHEFLSLPHSLLLTPIGIWVCQPGPTPSRKPKIHILWFPRRQYLIITHTFFIYTDTEPNPVARPFPAHVLILSSRQPAEVGAIVPILQMRKARLREGKYSPGFGEWCAWEVALWDGQSVASGLY